MANEIWKNWGSWPETKNRDYEHSRLSPPACAVNKQKVQETNHGSIYTSGPVYGNYAIYVSNSTANFPTDQNLALVVKSNNNNFKVAYYPLYDF